ncbi:putative aldehyde dehydrogenase FUS7, partial [Fusarium oxysporum f. sp. albedinis]
ARGWAAKTVILVMNDCQQSYDFSTYSTANIFQYVVPFEK